MFGESNKQIERRSQMLEQNKEIALNVSRAIMNGEWDKVEKLLAEEKI